MAVAMSVLQALAPLSNGAAVRIWSDLSPLCVVAGARQPGTEQKEPDLYFGARARLGIGCVRT